MIQHTDIVTDLCLGDTGKGKIVSHLIKSKNYDRCIRVSGSNNCGHAFYHKNQRVTTHAIPSGAVFGIRSIISNNCVLHIGKFLNELQSLFSINKDIHKLVKVDYRTHIILDSYIQEEQNENKIGSTRVGNGPAYREKYNRSGHRAEEFNELKPYLIDIYEELYNDNNNLSVLCEGAQGWGLDINFGDYPYVTSSSCGVAAVLESGINPALLRNIYGVMKSYTTYSGFKNFQPQDEVFNKIQQLGFEIGATTGRKRQCNWNNMKQIKQAIQMNSVSHLIINKMDILNQLGIWCVYDIHDTLTSFDSESAYKQYLHKFATDCGVKNIYFSYQPEFVEGL